MYFSEDFATTSENEETDAKYAPTSSKPHFLTKKRIGEFSMRSGSYKIWSRVTNI